MPKRRQILEVFAPTLGIKADSPSLIMDPRSQPTGQNGKMFYGCNQKEYGTSVYATGAGSALGAPINFIFEAKYPSSNVLQVFTHTGVNKYTSGSDSFVSDGQVFTGTISDYWSGIMHNDAFVYSNGVDNIQIKSAFAATGITMASATNVTTYKAYTLASFYDHLNLYRTIESGTNYYKRVRWTKKGVLTYTAATTDFASGTAGAIDLQDCEGEIKTAVPVGAGMAVYAERSVHIQFFVGGDEVYRFEKVISGHGTPSRRGAIAYKGVNYFVSHDNFHAYYGGDDMRDIGDPVRPFAFGDINNSAMASAYIEVDPKEEEVLFHVPTGTASLPNRTWVYRINDNSWSVLHRSYTASGRFTRRTGLTIGELIGPIGAQTWKFGDAFVSVESLTRLYGDQSGRVVKHDPTVYSVSESGTSAAQTFIYETPDYTASAATDPATGDRVDFTGVEKRWTQFNVEMAGNGTANILYSTNKGSTFVELPESPVTLVNSGSHHVLDIDASSKQIRWRITQTGQNEFIGIKYHSTEFIPGSEN